MTKNYRLQRLRMQHGWRQNDLAEQLGVSVTTIYRWEHGIQRPTPYYCTRLSTLFSVNLQDLGIPENEPEEVSDDLLPPFSSSPTVQEYALWTIPYPRNPHFTGREDVLATLKQHFVRSPSLASPSLRQVALTQSHAIKGLGGIGKTQIALEYAYRAHDQGRYRHILWLAVASEETLLVSLAALHERIPALQSAHETDQRTLATRVKRWLEQSLDPWLLIVDNADDPSFLPAYLPVQGPGDMLFTTRASAVGAWTSSLEIASLSQEEGTRLLLRRALREAEASPLEQGEAGAIVEAFGRFPLAIDQAGAYLEETGSTLQDYTQLLQNHQYALLARRGAPMGGHLDSVTTTWILSFERIEQANPAAAEFLQFCAFVAPDHIPEELLTEGAQYWPDALREAVSDRFRFNQMLETVLAFSLVKRVGKERVLSLHRLVQVVQRARMTPEDQHEWARRLVLAVNAVFPHDPELELACWPQCQRLLEQALACDKLIQEYHLQLPEAAELLDRAGSYLRDSAQYKLAEALYQRALGIFQQQSEPMPFALATTVHHLANLFWKLGKYEQAEPLYQRALDLFQQQVGAEHSEVANVLNNLGLLFFDQAKYDQAEQFYQQALQIGEPQGEPARFLLASILNNLGMLAYEQGEYARAEEFCQRSLQMSEQQPGQEHVAVAARLQNLAATYIKQGKLVQVEPLYQRALAIYERHLGLTHPSVAGLLGNLGYCYGSRRNYSQAEPLYQRALAIYERHLEPEHPHLAVLLSNLAIVHYDRGEYEQTEQLCQRSVRIYRQRPGPEHFGVAFPLHWLARVAASRGQDDEAERLERQALHIWEKHLDSEHPHLAYAFHGLALLAARRGFEREAETCFERALLIRERRLGLTHLDTSDILADFAQFRSVQGRLPEAASLYQRALFIRQQQLGNEHPLTMQIQASLQKVLP